VTGARDVRSQLTMHCLIFHCNAILLKIYVSILTVNFFYYHGVNFLFCVTYMKLLGLIRSIAVLYTASARRKLEHVPGLQTDSSDYLPQRHSAFTFHPTWLPMTPSIATKFQYVNSPFLFSSHSLHVSVPTGHLQVRIYN
jgi:hypothetical protein